jgi:hypothetical protein
MNRFALLPPDVQALERERDALSQRLAHLSPNSRRGRSLRRRHTALTSRILRLEVTLDSASRDEITAPSPAIGEGELFECVYWWQKS